MSGSIISLTPSGSDIVIDGSTIALSPTFKPVITIGSQVFTENSASQFVVDGQTLSPGGVVTVSGSIISLAPSASDIVIGGSTILLSSPSGAGGEASFGGKAKNTSPGYTGKGGRIGLGLMGQMFGLGFYMLVLLLL